MKKTLTPLNFAYIAGFLDGDGSILAQIVRNSSYIYGFSIRLSVIFYQKTTNYWFLQQLKKQLKYGTLRQRKDGMSEYAIVSAGPVEQLLLALLPYLRLKKTLAKLILDIRKLKKEIKSPTDFIAVCRLVDQTQTLTYSKKRTITTDTVITFLKETNKLP